MSYIGRTHGSIGKKYTTIDYLEQKGKYTKILEIICLVLY